MVSLSIYVILYTIRKLLVPFFKRDTSRTGIPTITHSICVSLTTLVTHISWPFPIQIVCFKMGEWLVKCAL